MIKTVIEKEIFADEIKNVWVPRKSQFQNKVFSSVGLWPIFDDKQGYNRLLDIIKSAKETICLSSFLLADDQIEKTLLEKTKQRVRIYVLTSSEAQLRKLDKDELKAHDKEALSHHIKMLNTFVGKILCRSAEHLHAKFLLIDPIINGRFNDLAVGFISTANFTTKALQVNPEILIEISKSTMGDAGVSTIKELYAFFLQGFWEEASEELLEQGKWTGIGKQQRKSLQHYSLLPNTSRNSTSLRAKIIKYLKAPCDEIYISSYTFDSSHQTTSLLANLSNATIFSRLRTINLQSFVNINKNTSNKIYAHESLHAKFVLRKTQSNIEAIVFTANFSEKGLDEGFEIGVELTPAQSSALYKIILSWITGMNMEMRKKLTTNEIKLFEGQTVFVQKDSNLSKIFIKKEITNERQVNCNSINDYLSYTNREQLVNFQNQSPIVLNNITKIKVNPPQLPRNAIKLDEELKIEKHKFSTYTNKKGSQKYVTFSSERELAILLKSSSDLHGYLIVYSNA